MATATVETRLFTKKEYERLVAEGFFGPDERIELVEGVIYEMTPQNSSHATGVRLTDLALRPSFGEGFDIRPQLPLALDPDSEPAPDIAVVSGSPMDYFHSHPTTALLIVEVADSSLLHDRKRKARVYARAEIPEYWILNLVKRCLEVYRHPKDGAYTTREVLGEKDAVSPLARPDASIAIASLLPRLTRN